MERKVGRRRRELRRVEGREREGRERRVRRGRVGGLERCKREEKEG